MDPIRLAFYIVAMCRDNSLTLAQIKARLTTVKTSALANPDGPARGHDVAYYCDRVTAYIVSLETTVPPWPAEEIKTNLGNQIVNLIPQGLK